MEAKAFSPAHITGFFVPHYDPQDPARSGSRGAGYSITKGVTTHVHAEPSPKDSVEIKGSRVTFEGKPAIIAAEVKKGGETLTLRDDAGLPVWSGWRR